ncbi:mannose-6-phosphate isomerase-like protein (cupin superfamily) [Rhizobium tibeticum]|nr:mannose-6-phosphate isomerase-like protein (cupin superfamily) [Rhizobium tibeticum]
MSAAPVIHMPDENKGVILRGHPMVFLVTGEDTKHTGMFDWTIPAGFVTGLHIHRVQEETFYMLDGECVWHVGDKTIRATPGILPVHSTGRATQHHQRQRKTGARADDCLSAWTRALFEELAKLAERGSPDPKALADLRSRYDTDQISTLTTRT